jgi:hypothetical protein
MHLHINRPKTALVPLSEAGYHEEKQGHFFTPEGLPIIVGCIQEEIWLYETDNLERDITHAEFNSES